MGIAAHFRNIFVSMKKTAWLLLASTPIFFGACVSKKQVQSMQDEHRAESNRLNGRITGLSAQIDEFVAIVELKNQQIAALKNDTAEKALRIAQLETEKADLARKLAECEIQLEQERRSLGQELSTKNNTLQNKEIALNRALAEAEAEKARAGRLSESLSGTIERVRLLEKELSMKDSAARALRESVARALTGFTGNDLQVEVKNGKVYVSMQEKLLFATGSTAVDRRGREALLSLAEALRNQKDIIVQVEGHTDDQPIRGGTIRDNWDLSVLRATSIVRILTADGKLESTRVYATGRGEFLPVDAAKTNEARARNRRTDIILTPRLDKILEIIDP
jgi:chemotaxis protein MotB